MDLSEIEKDLEEAGKLFPKFLKLYQDSKAQVVAAKAASSPGGSTITLGETLGIVEKEAPALIAVVAEAIQDVVSG